MDINSVVLVGRLTRDPELRYTKGEGTPVATFTLAVNRMKKGEADFVPLVVWQKQAENCTKYLAKGSQVAVQGRLQIRHYEDKEGQRKTVAEVVAHSVMFLSTGGARPDDREEIEEDDVPF